MSAPSGAGKSTLARNLIERSENVIVSVSTTTRQPRPGELHGEHYFFTEKEAFLRDIENGQFLEWAEVFGNYYGTSKKMVEDALAAGSEVILDIDWQGARLIRESLDAQDIVGVSIVPPSIELLEERLINRGQDAAAVIKKRMDQAVAEMSHWQEFDYVVINDVLEQAQDDLLAIVRAERLRRHRMLEQIEKIINL